MYLKKRRVLFFLASLIVLFAPLKLFANNYSSSVERYRAKVKAILDVELAEYKLRYPQQVDIHFDIGAKVITMHLDLYAPPFEVTEKLQKDLEKFNEKFRLVTAKFYHIYLLKEYFYYTPVPFIYIGKLTLDAKTTYQERMGNCFALTNMFIGITRKTGLTSNYYYVADINSNYIYEGTLITTYHIVCGIQGDTVRPYIIDFLPDPDENYRDLFRFNRIKKLTDLEAAGLFYNNIACKFMLEKDYGYARYLFEFAECLYPNSDMIKNNIAVLYKRTQEYDKALKYFLEALRYSKNPQHIISNIIRTKKYLSKKKAEEVTELISEKLEKNYYWHLLKAEDYIEAKDYKNALKEVKKAEKLSPKNQEVISMYLRIAVLTNDKELYEKYSSQIKKY